MLCSTQSELTLESVPADHNLLEYHSLPLTGDTEVAIIIKLITCGL